MSIYFNVNQLAELFAGVDQQRSIDARLASLDSLKREFTMHAVNAYERIAYERSEQGWTLRQIADEIGVSRNHIPSMITAYAERGGLVNPLRHRRRYEHAVDLTQMIRSHAKRAAEERDRAE